MLSMPSRIDGKYAIILTGSAKPSSAGAHPVTLNVPYAAGGGDDVMARTAAEKMSTLGQQIVIENRGRSAPGGSIATRQIEDL
jgi:tripartite-type tricarboxylate transporter receptor subunit TctC